MALKLRELDPIVLSKPVDGWPAGSHGVVVSLDGAIPLVEMATEAYVVDGLPRRELFDDLVDVPYDAIKGVNGSRPR